MTVFDNIVSGVQKVRDVSKKMNDAEMQNTVADLMLNIAEFKLESVQLVTENAELRQETQQLRTQADIRSKVGLRNGYYYLTEEIPGYSNGPFCPLCLDDDGKLITMRHGGGDKYFCTRCQSSGLAIV